MKHHARVVLIGGGIAGCSTLYHLTKMGWSDVVLVEKMSSHLVLSGWLPEMSRNIIVPLIPLIT